ncbi:MAG: hypothetical protein A3G27_11375 [Betaproteobacteria bacterium RIFCSPLOWO2_12_FULL_66_14]|nr:MAG: hypothetical protein A3G27_11375 [Betaproteobacteria bacterium RIFCSPLOWO2_12_FULL_66_14]
MSTASGARRSREVGAPSAALQEKSGAVNSTADRAIDILLLFSEERPRWTLQEIAAHFGMPRTTSYRYINSLRAYALIVEDEKGGYRLGPRIFPLARIARAGISILNVAAPALEALNATFGEAVTFYERVDQEVIALTRLECRHRVRLTYIRGQLLPWPATASSKVLLANAALDEQQALLRLMEPVRYTRKTVASLKALRQVLERIRRQGYAYSDEERDQGTLLHQPERPYVPTH